MREGVSVLGGSRYRVENEGRRARARARACVCVTLELTDFGVALASSLEAVAEDGFQLRAQARDPAK